MELEYIGMIQLHSFDISNFETITNLIECLITEEWVMIFCSFMLDFQSRFLSGEYNKKNCICELSAAII